MKLKILDFNYNLIGYINDYISPIITHKLEYGDKELTFTLPLESSDIDKLKEQYFIEYQGHRFCIKQIVNDINILCQLDIEDLQGTVIEEIIGVNDTITELLTKFDNKSGWTFEVVNFTKRRTINMTRCSIWELIKEIIKTYTCEIKIDSINRIVYFSEEFGEDLGVYFTEGLNLDDYSITSDTYNLYTRIIPLGVGDLDITNINNGKKYIDNFQFSNKIKTFYWKDERYIDQQQLKDDAEIRLKALSKPNLSIELNVRDLASLSNDYYKFKVGIGDYVIALIKGNKQRHRVIEYVENINNPFENIITLSNVSTNLSSYLQEQQNNLNNLEVSYEKIKAENGEISLKVQTVTKDLDDKINEVDARVDSILNDVGGAIADGIIDESETIMINSSITQLNKEKETLTQRYNYIYGLSTLASSMKSSLKTMMDTYNTKQSALISHIQSMTTDKHISDSERTTYNTRLTEYSTALANVNKKIEECMDSISTSKVNTAKAEIKVTTDAITQSVTSLSNTVSTKADGSTVETLSNKVGTLETSVDSITGSVSSLEETTTTLGTQVDTAQDTANSAVSKADKAQSTANTANTTANSNKNNITNLQGEVSTVKNNVASLEVTTSGISQKVSNVESTTATLTTKVNTAQSTADSANTLANSKAKVFTSTPTVPYKVGDLWVQGTSGDVMKCKTARTSGSYAASDWEKASKYTDDTKANAVDSKVTTLTTTVNTTNSKVAEITTNLDSITQRVSSTESTTATLTERVNTAQSTADSASNSINNLEVGGANLVKNSAKISNINITSEWKVVKQDDLFNYLTIDTTSTGWIECQIPLYTNYNDLTGKVTVSFDYYESVNGALSFNFGAYQGNTRKKEISNWIVNDWVVANSFRTSDLTNGWKRAYFTFNVDSVNNVDGADTYKIQFKKTDGVTGAIKIRKPKLEVGNKATSWTPAPEDVQKEININTLEISTTNNKVASIETNLDSITQRVASTETTTTTLTTKVNTAQSTADSAKTTANTANTNATNALNTANNVTNLANAMKSGKMLHTDPNFRTGMNGVVKYANSNASNIEVTRITKPSDCPSTSTHCIQLKHIGTASPNLGGFYQTIQSRANAIFIQKIIAKIPTGYSLNLASNSMGDEYKDKWLTSNAGTGKWEEYIREVRCGSTGTFSSGGHIHISGATPSSTNPLIWYVAYATVIDVTDNDERVNTLTVETTNTKNKVATIETNLNGIISRVSNVETKTNTIDGKVTAQETRLATAEQKITPSAITSTVRNSTEYQNDLGAKASTEQFTQLKQEVDNFEFTVASSGGGNLIVGGHKEYYFDMRSSTETQTKAMEIDSDVYKISGQKITLSVDIMGWESNWQDNLFIGFEMGVTYSDGTKGYYNVTTSNANHLRPSIHGGYYQRFVSHATMETKTITGGYASYYIRGFNGEIKVKNACVNLGHNSGAYADNNVSLVEGITRIDAKGITIEHTETNTKTNLDSEGLSVLDKSSNKELAYFGRNNSAYIDKLEAKQIISDDVIPLVRGKGNVNIYVSVGGSGNGSGTDTSNYAPSITSALEKLAIRWGLKSDQFKKGITLEGTTIIVNCNGTTSYSENVYINNIKGGSINLTFAVDAQITGTISFVSCDYAYVIGKRSGAGTNNGARFYRTGGGNSLNFNGCGMIACRNFRMYNTTRSGTGINAYWGGSMHMIDVDIYGYDIGVCVADGLQLLTSNVRGHGMNTSVSLNYGSTLIARGLYFSADTKYALGSTHVQPVGGTDNVPTTSMQAAPPAPTYTSQTNEFSGNSYKSVRPTYSSDGVFNQSHYNSSYGAWTGYVYFSSVSDWLSNSSGQPTAKVFLQRKNTSHGYPSGARPNLVGYGYLVGDSTGTNGLSQGQGDWFTIPATIINEFQNGTRDYLSFTDNSAQHYICFENNTKLKVIANKPN